MAEYRYDEKTGFDGRTVKVLGATFEEGRPEEPIDWRQRLTSREDVVGFLRTALRYWYSSEWYGSEKRKEEA